MLRSIFLGYVRHALTAGCGYLFAHGLVSQSDSQVLISAALGIAGVAWSTAAKLIQDYELRNARNPVQQPPVHP